MSEKNLSDADCQNRHRREKNQEVVPRIITL